LHHSIDFTILSTVPDLTIPMTFGVKVVPQIFEEIAIIYAGA
jgi:hypothetical protein